MKTLMMTAATLALATPGFAQSTSTTPSNDPSAVVIIPSEGAQTGDAATGTTGMTTEGAGTTGVTTQGAGATTGTTMGATGTDAAAAPMSGTDGAAMGQTAMAPMSEQNPGISAEWMEGRAIYTTNQPSTTPWDNERDWGTERPGDWEQIAEISDVVLSQDGQVMGYVADIGGFLGLGERTVMLSPQALNLVDFEEGVLWGSTAVFVTNYSQEELEALPEVEDDFILR